MISSFFKKLLLSRTVEIDSGEFKLFNTNFFLGSVKSHYLLREELKKKNSLDILYMFGERISKDILEYFKKIGGGKEESVKFWLNMINLAGFGEIEILEINPKNTSAAIKCKNSPIAREYFRLNKSEMVDETLSGIIGGFFKEWFGKEIICKEISCVAKRNNHCQFEIKKK